MKPKSLHPLPDAFEQWAEFWDVEGIPVSWAAVKGVVCSAAWDVDPPRFFAVDSARRNGNPITAAEFRELVASIQASMPRVTP